MNIEFPIDDKPNLQLLIERNPNKARDFLKMWLECADRLISLDFPANLITETSEQLNLKPADIVAGIVAGCLNEQFVNEQMASILGKELLPIALLTLKDTTESGEEVYYDWRKWYHLDKRQELNADAIAKAIGNIMKYARFLDFSKLTEAMETNQLIIFKSLPMEQAKLLPYYPALRYQKDLFGEFSAGTFFDDRKAGFFNCGEIDAQAQECEACGRSDLKKTKDGKYIYCKACNAVYKLKGATT